MEEVEMNVEQLRKQAKGPRQGSVAVMEQLVAACAELEPAFWDVAQGPLADWLRRFGAR